MLLKDINQSSISIDAMEILYEIVNEEKQGNYEFCLYFSNFKTENELTVCGFAENTEIGNNKDYLVIKYNDNRELKLFRDLIKFSAPKTYITLSITDKYVYTGGINLRPNKEGLKVFKKILAYEKEINELVEVFFDSNDNKISAILRGHVKDIQEITSSVYISNYRVHISPPAISIYVGDRKIVYFADEKGKIHMEGFQPPPPQE